MSFYSPLSHFDSSAYNEIVRDLRLSPPPSPSTAPLPTSLPNLVSQAHCSKVKQTVDPSKLTVVLDLDETLLHSYFPDKLTMEDRLWLQHQIHDEQCRIERGELKLEQQSLAEIDVGDNIQVITVLRPQVHRFLKQLMAQYNVVVWSAGGANYVNGVVNTLFDSRIHPLAPITQLCWDHVVVMSNGIYTKPLTVVAEHLKHGVDLTTIILIDNRAENAFFQPMSLILATDFAPTLDEIEADAIDDDFLMKQCVEHLNALTATIQASRRAATTFKQAARRSLQAIGQHSLLGSKAPPKEPTPDKPQDKLSVSVNVKAAVGRVQQQIEQKVDIEKKKRQSLFVPRQRSVGQLVQLFN